jgi:3-(3-hydroxy-phenyl)propionate hydroxylase
MTEMYDVAVIGLGPVGAALCNLLAQSGLRVVAFDAFDGPYSLPRATHLDGEALRILQNAGVSETLEPSLGIYTRMRFVNAQGDLLLDWPRSVEEGWQGWRDSNRFHQPALETALRENAQRHANLDLHLGQRVEDLSQDRDGVTILTRSPAQQSQTFRARYVVGCDGARSTVRAVMGVELQVLDKPEQWLVVDLIINGAAPALPEGTIQYCDPARPITYIEAVGARRRWEVMLIPGDDASRFAEPGHVWSLLAPWVSPGDAEIERAVVYTFNSAVAERWRRGRMLLAGDAAHQTPPFLGQGLCAGLRDAANLGWKLAWVVKGLADERLLDTYPSEMKPHVTAFIVEANRIGAIIQERDPEMARQRDEALRTGPQLLKSVRPSLGPGLTRSEIGPAASLSAQPRLKDGRRLDDLAPYGFILLCEPGFSAEAPPRTRDLWRQAGLTVVEGEGADWLESLGAKAVIIRPDRYILGVANDLVQLEAITSQIPLRLKDALCD